MIAEQRDRGILGLIDPKARSARARRCMLASFDAAAWAVALVVALVLRYDFATPTDHIGGLLVTIVIAVTLQVAGGAAVGLYRGRWRLASFEEVAVLAPFGLAVTAVLAIVNMIDGRLVPGSVPLIAGALALLAMLSARYVVRHDNERRRRPDSDACTGLILFGAGHAAAEAIGAMRRDPRSPYAPVALLDDDPARRNLTIMGVPVVGNRHDMASAAERFGVSALLIAIRPAPPRLTREVADLAKEAGLEVKVLPSVRELIDGTAKVGDIRSPTIPDLLGRGEIRTDMSAAASYLNGRRVLVTGAGGSIGSELCRQIRCFEPSELMMIDRDESALHALQLSMEGRALLDSPDLILLDIRDRLGLEKLFAARRPEVVFHAAALKHLPILELHPAEAVKTNIWGTLNVLEASVASGVSRFVNISTDKAVNPCSVLGYSKRICERLTSAAAGVCPESIYLSVRFGNVLGSSGSVLHTFKAQIAAGGPVTVTDPDVRRYFMTVEEAIQLVIQAGAVGSSAEALVLDMGEPVRISEVADRMIQEADQPIDIVYTGLRKGEKLDEILFNDGEPDVRLRHPLISHVPVPPLHPARVARLNPFDSNEAVVARLAHLSAEPGLRASDQPHSLDIRGVRLETVPSHAAGPGSRSSRPVGNVWEVVVLPPGGGTDPHFGCCPRHRRKGDRHAVEGCQACSSMMAEAVFR